MVRLRIEFQAEFGRAAELIEILREGDGFMERYGFPAGRLMVDLTGPRSLVVLERDFESVAQWETIGERVTKAPEFEAWERRRDALVQSGTRQWFRLI